MCIFKLLGNITFNAPTYSADESLNVGIAFCSHMGLLSPPLAFFTLIQRVNILGHAQHGGTTIMD